MQDKVYAGFFVRLGAYLIDMTLLQAGLLSVRIMGLFASSVGGSTDLMGTRVLFNFSLWAVVSYIITGLYFILLTYFNGRTIGKMIFKIRVISRDNPTLSFFEVFFRETFGKYLSAVIINIGFLMVAVDKQKRGLHDRLSDTLVVYDNQNDV